MMPSENASTQPDLGAIRQRHHDWHHDPRGNQSIAEVVRDREALLTEVDRLREFVRRFVASAAYDDEDLMDAFMALWDDAVALLDDRTETT